MPSTTDICRHCAAVALIALLAGPAARAIRLGYKNVLWYRGGLEAWQRAGQPLVPAGQGQTQAMGGQR
jgi:rhodanese-related sulfurtransferase